MSHTSFARHLPLVALVALVALSADRATPAHGASFTVNATHDAVDAAPGDGVCSDAGGACTLRAAVMETNALPGADEISLPAGTYVLSIAGAGEDAAATGDLDVTDDLAVGGLVVVNGAPEPQTTVDAGGLDRVFHVRAAGNLALLGLIIQGGSNSGSPDFGGGVFNESAALRIVESEIRANSSASFGGGVFTGANSLTTISSSTITGNTAREGGGVFTVSGALTTVEYTSIKNNVPS